MRRTLIDLSVEVYKGMMTPVDRRRVWRQQHDRSFTVA